MQLQVSDKSLHFMYLTLSFVGLVILIVLTFTLNSSGVPRSLPRPLIGLIFAAICSLGIVAAISPSTCRALLHKPPSQSLVRFDPQHRMKGHHPTCQNYASHTLQIGGKTYCSGCLGLVIGAMIALIGNLIFFSDVSMIEYADILFWLGVLFVVLGLLQHNLKNVITSSIRVVLNIVFVVGSFILLLAVTELNGTPYVELYLFALMFYWIFTRIMLSQFTHNRICNACTLGCDIYSPSPSTLDAS